MARLVSGRTILEEQYDRPRSPLTKKEKRYLQHLSPEEVQKHLNARRYPSGQWSRGGANRSAKVARERRQRTIVVARCPVCGGVTQDVRDLTNLFALCGCPST
jgi:hypothetical protein